MTWSILICDDSSFAQKQVARALPEDLQASIYFASNGQEAIKFITSGKGEVLFLDLNMPIMDGYQTLEVIRAQKLDVDVIVVSGDIQPEAHRRVMSLGAKAFIKKPVDRDELAQVINTHNLFDPARKAVAEAGIDILDGCREVANIAMGQASDLLARVLNAFVIMPIPHANMIEASELRMAIEQAGNGDQLSAVCQGFIGSGIAGEAMLMFSESSYEDIAKMTNYDGELDESAQMELLMDLSNILIGACLKGIADQFDISFSLSHPIVIGRHCMAHDLLTDCSSWTRTLAIDMNISIENNNVHGSLLLLFTEDSLPKLNQLISFAAA